MNTKNFNVPPSKKGKFVVLEGLDGSRKTSLGNALRYGYRNRSKHEEEHDSYVSSAYAYSPIDFVSAPSIGRLGYLIRDITSNDKNVCNIAKTHLFMADMHQTLFKEVIPALDRGELVLSDRWWYSTYAYQGENIDKNYILRLAQELEPQPDLVIKLVISPKNQMLTLNSKDKDLFESRGAEYYVEVEERYMEVLTREGSPEMIIVSADDFDALVTNVTQLLREVMDV